jgi:altronate hydrolase
VKSALVISVRDNVATALQALGPGQRLDLGGSTLIVEEPIAPGHKIALRRIAAGEPVIKYGSPIGIASRDIAAGTHVHTHNVASSRGRGDLEVQSVEPQARLAEPPDDPPMRGADTKSDAAAFAKAPSPTGRTTASESA